VSAHVGYFGDMMATFAELGGATAPENIDSISIVPTLLRPNVPRGRAPLVRIRPQPQHRYLYWEFHEGGFSQAALLHGRWKGIRLKRLDAPIQLYDLHTDPAEQSNVALTHPVIVKQVEMFFQTARTDSPLWPIKEAPLKKEETNP
jgi:arylsulfatase A-like enzyme